MKEEEEETETEAEGKRGEKEAEEGEVEEDRAWHGEVFRGTSSCSPASEERFSAITIMFTRAVDHGCKV